MIQPAQFSTEG